MFYRGIRKYIGSMKKSCIGLGFASPNTTFFHGPNIFSYPPCKTLYNEFIPLKAFFLPNIFSYPPVKHWITNNIHLWIILLHVCVKVCSCELTTTLRFFCNCCCGLNGNKNEVNEKKFINKTENTQTKMKSTMKQK